MGLRQTAAPVIEPVTLAEAKTFLRIDEDITADDAMVTRLIRAARRQAEKVTCRQLLTATWLLTLDGFFDRKWAYRDDCLGWCLTLTQPRLQSVTAIQYVDVAGATQTLDAEAYVVDAEAEPARVFAAVDSTWPATLMQPGSVSVTFVAGSDAASDVADDIVTGILICLDDWYNGRGGVKGAVGDVPPPALNLWRSCWHGAMA
jgi:uncharacterized phiE125 gp8 family phage protein